MSFRGTVKTVPYGCRGDSRIARRFRPLREGAVKCVAFDWGRDFSVYLPPSFACGKSHLPLRGRGYGSSSYGCAITPLSLRDISPNRGISPTPTHEMECVHPHNPQFILLKRGGFNKNADKSRKKQLKTPILPHFTVDKPKNYDYNIRKSYSL